MKKFILLLFIIISCCSSANASSVISWGKEVTVSRNQPAAAHLTDGSVGSLGNSWNSGANPPGWVRIHFDEVVVIEQVIWYAQVSSTITQNYSLYIDDTFIESQSPTVYQNQQTPVTFVLSESVLGQEVRIDVSGTGSWLAAWEVEVYGEEIPVATVPEPASIIILIIGIAGLILKKRQ